MSDGSVVVAEVSPEAYKEKARVKVSEEGDFTFPSFSGGAVFVPNMKHIGKVDVASARR